MAVLESFDQSFLIVRLLLRRLDSSVRLILEIWSLVARDHLDWKVMDETEHEYAAKILMSVGHLVSELAAQTKTKSAPRLRCFCFVPGQFWFVFQEFEPVNLKKKIKAFHCFLIAFVLVFLARDLLDLREEDEILLF